MVSIHAPAWGATRHRYDSSAACRRFNPRARMGRDIEPLYHVARSQCFNPRARMGRDVTVNVVNNGTPKFQSTRPHGARPLRYRPCKRLRWFQSTRPHGARRRRSPARPIAPRFQSTRPHGARRPPAPRRRSAGHVSIHAPAWGATRDDGVDAVGDLFQSTRPHGARRLCLVRWTDPDCFNPRARMGRDDTPVVRRVSEDVSIHAPAWGATPRQQARRNR